MAIQKYEYELSVWDEELASDGKKVEKQSVIIGGHDMSYLGRATSIQLKREIKGTNTLTFKMPTKFYDSERGTYVKNELIDYLYNEKKVKLKFQDTWYEFYIKAISEEKQFKAIMKTFTCGDSFIDELSRTGYEIIFDSDLYNNVEEVGNFMQSPNKDGSITNAILDKSIWDYTPEYNWGDFTEFTEERCYKIPIAQFGGKISAHPISLIVPLSAYNKESEYCKDWDEEFNKKAEKANEIVNAFTYEKRQLEYGDDLARAEEIFWDPYYKDNGTSLTNSDNIVSIISDYIYVPISQLKYVYGSLYEGTSKATQSPAMYGPKGTDLGYALQPWSKNPTDFIQFIAFENDDDIIIDESGTIINNDHHFLISIGEWNQLVKLYWDNLYENMDEGADRGCIYWSEAALSEDDLLTEKYQTVIDGDITYSVNVQPQTCTIDDFDWWPVRYEGYLEVIGQTEVYAARKISVTDRTEWNLNAGAYVTIYNNQDVEYSGQYSDKELNDYMLDKAVGDRGNFLDFRVSSNQETRLIMPTLARNLVQNGTQITDVTGWESKTQKSETLTNTATHEKLLSYEVKAVNGKEEENNGNNDDEYIQDYYLEITSPYLISSPDYSVNGEVTTDYLLNFGLIGSEKIIEKDKIYAIRICTGSNQTIQKNLIYRNSGKGKLENASEEQFENYEAQIEAYGQYLMSSNTISSYDEHTSLIQIQNDLKNWIAAQDEKISEQYMKFENIALEDDYGYIVGKLRNKLKGAESEEDQPTNESSGYVEPIVGNDSYNELNKDTINTWKESVLEEITEFIKQYNIDLDKIIIGQGSIDQKGNYIIEGIDNVRDPDKYITFEELFELQNQLSYLPRKTDGEDAASSILQSPLYHKKNFENIWSWNSVQGDADGAEIEDYPFLLFKAKATITNPYIALKISSKPAEVSIDSLIVTTYQETGFNGVKLESWSINSDGLPCLVDGVNYYIYEVKTGVFSDNFITEAKNYLAGAEGTIELKDGDFTSKVPDWNGKSSSVKNLYYTKIEPDDSSMNQSKIYALFTNQIENNYANAIFQGVFQFKKENQTEETEQDQENEGTSENSEQEVE